MDNAELVPHLIADAQGRPHRVLGPVGASPAEVLDHARRRWAVAPMNYESTLLALTDIERHEWLLAHEPEYRIAFPDDQLAYLKHLVDLEISQMDQSPVTGKGN